MTSKKSSNKKKIIATVIGGVTVTGAAAIYILKLRRDKRNAVKILMKYRNNPSPEAIRIRNKALDKIGKSKKSLKRIKRKVSVDSANHIGSRRQSITNTGDDIAYTGLKKGGDLDIGLKFKESGNAHNRILKAKKKFAIEVDGKELDVDGRVAPLAISGKYPSKHVNIQTWIDQIINNQRILAKKHNRLFDADLENKLRISLKKIAQKKI